ncbi:MAG: chalcone isomerase family protein, partial [Motiliproteus sp.]|nr:chalcone isomerase family protein [Motiliproteus sp.]
MYRNTLLLLVLIFTPKVVYSSERCSTSGIDWPDELVVGSKPLKLNGIGSRTKWVWDVYSAALYLPEQEKDPNKIFAMDGAKRIAVKFLYDVPAEKLVEGWRDGFELNHNAEQLLELADNLERSYALLQDMEAGDQILL